MVVDIFFMTDLTPRDQAPLTRKFKRAKEQANFLLRSLA